MQKRVLHTHDYLDIANRAEKEGFKKSDIQDFLQFCQKDHEFLKQFHEQLEVDLKSGFIFCLMELKKRKIRALKSINVDVSPGIKEQIDLLIHGLADHIELKNIDLFHQYLQQLFQKTFLENQALKFAKNHISFIEKLKNLMRIGENIGDCAIEGDLSLNDFILLRRNGYFNIDLKKMSCLEHNNIDLLLTLQSANISEIENMSIIEHGYLRNYYITNTHLPFYHKNSSISVFFDNEKHVWFACDLFGNNISNQFDFYSYMPKDLWLSCFFPMPTEKSMANLHFDVLSAFRFLQWDIFREMLNQGFDPHYSQDYFIRKCIKDLLHEGLQVLLDFIDEVPYCCDFVIIYTHLKKYDYLKRYLDKVMCIDDSEAEPLLQEPGNEAYLALYNEAKQRCEAQV